MTSELKQQIENNNIYVCERHFKHECILSSGIIICITSLNYGLVVFVMHMFVVIAFFIKIFTVLG